MMIFAMTLLLVVAPMPPVRAVQQGQAGQASASEGIHERVERSLDERRTELIAFRHDLHRHPELSGEEERTSAAVAKALHELGLEVRANVGGYGVVAVLEGAGSGPVLGFRADMDAVRSQADDPVEFASERPGVRHICGHDVHTTTAVALAHALHAVRDAWSGKLVLYFQPAEETASGARAMIADGALDDPTPEAVFAYHSSPLAVGQIGVTPLQALPARDAVRVRVEGQADLRQAAERVGQAIAGLTTLEEPWSAPSQTEDFLVAQAYAPRLEEDASAWIVAGQVTSSSRPMSARARASLAEALAAMESDDLRFELEYEARQIPGVFNDPDILAQTEEALRGVVGADNYVVSHGTPPQFSEDFGHFQDRAPGIMYWLGVSNPATGTRGMPHSPDFVADDEAVFVGARAMAAVLLSRFDTP